MRRSGESDAILEALKEIARLKERVETLERMDAEAGQVELVICMHSRHFTGEPPYVGWPGLALALAQDYALLESLMGKNK